MGKSPKKRAAKAAKQTPRAPAPTGDASDLLELSITTLRRGLVALDRCVEKVSTMLIDADEYDTKLASHLAWMTSQLAGQVDACRKLEVHDHRQVETVTPEQRHANVLVYLEHELPAAKRTEILDLLERLRGEEGLLS